MHRIAFGLNRVNFRADRVPEGSFEICRAGHHRSQGFGRATSYQSPQELRRHCAAAAARSGSSIEENAAQVARNGTLASTSSRPGEVLIEFQEVQKSFGSKAILKGASFKIYRGEAVGIIGASGTGKSTALRLAAGLLMPDQGRIIIKGQERTGLLSDEGDSNLKVGMVFQSGALFDSLTVGENVGFLLYEHSSLPPSTVKELVGISLGSVGLSGVEDLYPSQLSGGMRKRVALARAIVTDANSDVEQVLMYDEPTAGLDPVASTVIEDLMRDLHTNSMSEKNGSSPSGFSSYIVVTHQHSTIRRAVDRLIFLHDGKVAWEGTTKDFETTSEPIVRQFATGSLQGPIQYV